LGEHAADFLKREIEAPSLLERPVDGDNAIQTYLKRCAASWLVQALRRTRFVANAGDHSLANISIAAASTRVPSARSVGFAHSSGLWLMPFAQGTKIMPVGQMILIDLAS